MSMKPPTVAMMPGRHKRVQSGHPWAYSNEVRLDAAAKALSPGTVVRLTDAGGTPLGLALFNPHPLIAARLLTRDFSHSVDQDFLVQRLGRALQLRQRLYADGFYRLIHAEADGLPGLIVDRYGPVVVIQANSAGMDRLLSEIISAIETTMQPQAILVRNDSPARTLEGLPTEEPKLVSGALNGPIEILENGARFFADPQDGQKTGWFFDQRDNRAFIAGLASGRTVLDCYSYGGGFGVLCAVRGAAQVTLVDPSATALELALRAAKANGVADRVQGRRADVFTELESLAAQEQRFGVTICDPPAFVKSKKDLPAGSRAYRKLARLGAAVTEPGGILLLGSCSHNMTAELFAEQAARGLADAGRQGRILRSAGAAPDHPLHPNLPESAYLKVLVLEVD